MLVSFNCKGLCLSRYTKGLPTLYHSCKPWYQLNNSATPFFHQPLPSIDHRQKGIRKLNSAMTRGRMISCETSNASPNPICSTIPSVSRSLGWGVDWFGGWSLMPTPQGYVFKLSDGGFLADHYHPRTGTVFQTMDLANQHQTGWTLCKYDWSTMVNHQCMIYSCHYWLTNMIYRDWKTIMK